MAAASALVVLTWIAYLPALGAGFVFDDTAYVTGDDRMGSLEGLWRIWTKVADYQQYYPLTSTALWVQYAMWGERPAGYHAVNVLLHGLNALLLWRVLLRLGVSGAWLAAAIFAIHPVHVQSVAWITEIKNVLSMLWFLLAALAFLRFFERIEAPATARSRWLSYTIGIAFFIAALLTKTVTAILPIALLLVLWWQRDRLAWRDLAALLPLLIVGAGFAGLTVHLEGQGLQFSSTPLERVLIAGRALWFYAFKLAWPVGLVLVYPKWEINTAAWWQYLFPLAALSVVLALWLLRRRFTRGPLVAVLYFVLALAPISFVTLSFNRFSWVADHWQYWASMGLIALAAALLHRGWQRLSVAPAIRPAVASALIVTLLVPLAVLTWRRCGVFESQETLWRDTMQRNPQAWIAYNNLANIAVDRNDPDEAERLLRRAIQIKPDEAQLHFNLGFVRQSRGRLDDAARHYQKAIELSPKYTYAYWNLGLLLASLGQLSDAVNKLESAVELLPWRADIRKDLGNTLLAAGRPADAADQLLRVVAARPDDADGHERLGVALADLGRWEQAEVQFEEAIQLQPNHAGALVGLADLLANEGQFNEAIERYRGALRAAPSLPEAHLGLGTAFAEVGATLAAIEHLRLATQLRADWPEALGGLAWILATHPSPEVRDGQRAVRLARRAARATAFRDATALDQLAAAYAEAGDFSSAATNANTAINLAVQAGDLELADRIRGRLREYRNGKPHRELKEAPREC